MLRLFRKIRYRMMDKNRMSKPASPVGRYFLYALGEIILVVIGILIALQINTWNGERNDRKKERAYLSEIRANLVQDSVQIQNVLKFNESKLIVVNNMITMFSDTLTNRERNEIFGNNMLDFTFYQTFKPILTSYNNLLNAESVDIIKDRKLRHELSDYYSYEYSKGVQERIIISNRAIVDDTYYKFMTKERVQEMLNFSSTMPTENSLEIHFDQKFFANLIGLTVIIRIQNELMHDISKQNSRIVGRITRYLQI